MKFNFKNIEGYVYGAIQPSTILSFHDASANDQSLLKKLETLLEYMPHVEDSNRFSFESVSLDQSSIPVIFVNILDALNHFCGDQRFTPIHVFQEDTSLSFALPTLSNSMTRFNMSAVKALLDVATRDNASAMVEDFLETHKRKTRPFLPSGTNAGNFIAAAAERKIPFKVFSPNYVIFGYGSGSRIFNSSITDEESAIGVCLAKSKVDTNRLLKMSGIPVAEQARVRTLEDALSFADKIGYPVVLKPESEEQGRGVFANIQNVFDLKKSFNLLIKNYTNILIEKHIIGDHYRIDFMGETLVKAVRRRAAFVVGDGISTVEMLINVLNAEPERLDQNSSKGVVKIDDDLYRCLENQRLKLSDVPQKDFCVYLRSISNLSRGGDQVHVESEIHPENYALCKAIARVFRLKICGIDLLSQDLSQPWYTNGTTVCEVNAQPQLGQSKTDVYWKLLRPHLGINPKLGLIIGNKPMISQTYLFDTSSECVEIYRTPQGILRDGCPVQYFDSLTIDSDVSDEDRLKINRMLVSVQPELGQSVS